MDDVSDESKVNFTGDKEPKSAIIMEGGTVILTTISPGTVLKRIEE